MQNQKKSWNKAPLFLFAIAGVLIAPTVLAENSTPVFTKDILPILQEKCQVCHRPNQIAPMSLLTYDEVRPWVKSIAKEVTSKNMPPFHANSPKDYFKDDTRLSDAEIKTIADWANGGAPRGDGALAPKPIDWARKPWLMGKPDQVLDFPEFEVTSDGVDDYILFYSDYVFPEDTWVQAIEFKSSNYQVVHHAGIFAVDSRIKVPENFMLLNTDGERDDLVVNKSLALIKQNFLYTWLPGQGIEYRDEGQGYLIHKGERFIIQVHFAPSDVPVKCDLQLGLEFVDGEINAENISLASIMSTLVVPANDPNYEVIQHARFLQDVTVKSFVVHMHLRGKSSKFVFHYEDGRSETVFDVPKYNFDWQRVYHLTDPFEIPKGTQVEFIGVWDNSAGNPLNPDPNIDSVWGMKTSDEMYGGTIHYTVDLDEPIPIKNGRQVK
jgi:hypothetical protein